MWEDDRQQKTHRILSKILIGWLIVFLVVGGVAVFVSARGEGVGLKMPKIELPASVKDFNKSIGLAPTGMMVSDTGAKLQLQKGNSTTILLYKLEKQLKSLSAVAYKNAIKTFMGQIAKRTAEQLAGGITGQKPAFETDVWGFIQEEADGALGDYLNNTIGKMWGKDLCEPLNPLAKVTITTTAKKIIEPGKPQCSFQKIRKNLKDLETKDLVQFSSYFDPNGNDLGALLTVTTGAINIREQAKEKSEFVKSIEGEFKSLRSTINESVETPAEWYKSLLGNALSSSQSPYLQYTGDAIADALGVFTNTLTSKVMKYYTEGLFKNKGGASSLGSGGAYGPAYGSSGVQVTQSQFADLAKVDYNFGSGTSYDVLESLSCGTETQYSCTIDPQLKKAIEDKMTVGEAMTQGKLRDNWPFGYTKDKSGGTADINQNIYSYRTLVILRKYRIIPVTWELAAEYYYKYDQSGQPITLKTLTDNYDNPQSPYYRLVDKGWVLKAPLTICQRQGYGEDVLEIDNAGYSYDYNNDGDTDDPGETQSTITRAEYCADERSCIVETPDGSGCDYYGYCTKEKNIWRIGSGGCEAQFTSCQTFTTRDGDTVSYLTNTLAGRDGTCDQESSVGCREYCVDYNPATGGWDCPLSAVGILPTGKRIYLNKYAEDKECNSDEAGCSQFIRMTAGLEKPSNWIPNGSFEYFQTSDTTTFNTANYNTGFATFSGNGSIVAERDGHVLDLAAGAHLNISINTERNLGGKEFIFSLLHKDPDLTVGLTNENNTGRVTKLSTVEYGDGYYKSAWKYDLLEIPNDNSKIISVDIGSDTIDELQLLETKQDQGYRNYGEVNSVNLPKAPANYNCQAYSTVNNTIEASCVAPLVWRADIQKCVNGGTSACDNYALYCSSEDVGCRFYEPTSYKGVKQPGVIENKDLCDKECVGYKQYLEQASFFEPTVAAGRNPVRLIAKSARTCSASENGCEEFTNLSKGTEGERLEYYTNLRACVLPGDTNIRNYYSWASSEEAGNQLRSWRLLMSNLGDYPCTNTLTSAEGVVTCNDTAATAKTCTLGSAIAADNPAYNHDCVEFVNTNNVATWIKYSQVVFAADDCTKLRRTTGTQEVYSAIPSLSQTCSAAAVGCREYKGSASNNTKIILADDFEDKTSQGWTGGTSSNESIIANGHSLLATGNINKTMSTSTLMVGSAYKLSFWAKAASGTVSVTASFSGDLIFGTGTVGGTSAFNINNEWGYYVVSLNDFNRVISTDEVLRIAASGRFYIDNIVLTQTESDLYLIKDSWQTPASCDSPAAGSQLGCEAYKDAENKEWYAKSFSKICYDYAVGCEAMIDTQNSVYPFGQQYNVDVTNNDGRDDVSVPVDKLVYLVYDKDKLCKDVGCTALGLVSATRDTAGISYENKYLIVNPADYNSIVCQAKEDGCEEFTLSDTETTGTWKFKDPGVFTCEYKAVNSIYGWYKTESNEPCPTEVAGGKTGYCRDEPEVRCKKDDHCAGSTSDECIFDRYCVGGRSITDGDTLNSCTTNTTCANYSTGKLEGVCSNWAAKCPAEANTCSEYQDPSTPENCNKNSVNYEYTTDSRGNKIPPCDFYYYQAKEVDTCASVDPAKGCIGVHQTYGGEDRYYGTRRCAASPDVTCETDTDCATGTGPCTDKP